MIGKFFFILFALASLSQESSGSLTKEITVDQSIQLKFRDVISAIETTDIPAELIHLIFSNFDQMYLNLTNLMQSQSVPDVSDILDVFNIGIGKRLLVSNENYVQVDSDALQLLLSDKVSSVARTLYPKNYFHQLILYGLLQKEIIRTAPHERSEIQSRKIPVEKFTAVLDSGAREISIRSSNSSDFLTELTKSLESILCNSIVSEAYLQLNTSLTTATNFLDTLANASISSNNGLISVLANLFSYAIELAKQAIAYVWELAEAFESSICDLLYSRKRRDLSFFQDQDGDQSIKNSGLVETRTQFIGTRTLTIITSVVWSLVAAVLSYALTSLVRSLILSLVSYLVGSFAEWIYSIIDSIF